MAVEPRRGFKMGLKMDLTKFGAELGRLFGKLYQSRSIDLLAPKAVIQCSLGGHIVMANTHCLGLHCFEDALNRRLLS